MIEKPKKINAVMLENRLIQFSVRVIKMAQSLPPGPACKHLGLQIIRSASSPALNYGEAQNAESIDDFVHKMKICLKELRETFICMKIMDQMAWFPPGKLTSLLSIDEIITSRLGGSNLPAFCVTRQLRSPTMRPPRALTADKLPSSKS